MKRDREKGQSSSSTSMASSTNKDKKTWEEDTGMDELLAVLGYKVKASDMADVAQKLEQLEMVMDQEDGISLLSDSVHKNPSDLSGWVQSMLYELNAGAGQPPNHSSTLVVDSSSEPRIYEDNSEYDLSAIPGGAICKQQQSPVLLQNQTSNKRIKTDRSDELLPPGPGICPPPGSTAARPVVFVDTQETGVRLVHTLIACAEAVQQENLKLADALVKHISLLAVAQAGAMRKVATYFAEALARRIYNFHPRDFNCSDLLQMHFYETCPYLKFAHFTANQAILEAFEGEDRVHVVDFGLKQGMQWPALMQALALRPGGAPKFRLTGIGPPQADNSDALQEVGWKLAQLAETIGVEFEFRGFVVNSLADLEAEILDIRPREVEKVAVNSVFELHQLLARPGSIEKVLDSIKRMRPKIVTIVEQEANHNGGIFVERFNEALHYYSTMFDSLEGSTGPGQALNAQDVVMTEVYLGRQICDVVACEGVDRTERHETLGQWRARMSGAGFGPAHLGSNAFKQASMLLALFGGGDGYRVEENDGCLLLGWHTRPLIATSAWQLSEPV